ncbi:hypothetical protein VNO80_26301 [Phaseolus coccineus]|uniref:Uncharacterized protein n=1 Tax=Phaseolus coccineus TaxID=3886 RepID=A0AAN9LEJ8_PHACN
MLIAGLRKVPGPSLQKCRPWKGYLRAGIVLRPTDQGAETRVEPMQFPPEKLAVMFMCMLSLTLEPLSATSGEHGMLQPTQSVLLDPMHNKDALVSSFSTLKPLSPTPFNSFAIFLYFTMNCHHHSTPKNHFFLPFSFSSMPHSQLQGLQQNKDCYLGNNILGSFSLMDSAFGLFLMTFSWVSFTFSGSDGQSVKSAHVLDLIIRDHTFKVILDKNLRTAIPQSVDLPANLSGIGVDAVRFRCGSLRRYGAHLKEFHLGTGVTVHPCIERVMLIRQNMGHNWSSIYYANYDLSGYQLVSPIVGLLAYNADDDANSSNPFQLGIVAGERPMTIDFTNTTKLNKEDGIKPLCASFEGDGRMTLAKANPSTPLVCVAKRHGHFGLVVESPPDQFRNRPISRWKVAVGSTIGAALGAFLLGLLLVAMLVRVKKRSRMVEMERRAYEEEALQVSMVGHVRAPTAHGTRTTPIIEHEYRPHPR